VAIVPKCVNTRGRASSALLWQENDRLLEIKDVGWTKLCLFISSIFAGNSAAALRSTYSTSGLTSEVRDMVYAPPSCPTATLPIISESRPHLPKCSTMSYLARSGSVPRRRDLDAADSLGSPCPGRPAKHGNADSRNQDARARQLSTRS
jgi:hypothetical protein